MTIPHSIEIPLFGVTSPWWQKNPDLIQVNYPDLIKKHKSIEPQYMRIIVPRFEVDWIKTQGEIALRNLNTEEYKEARTVANSICLRIAQI